MNAEILRILDVNLNRAREALRVVEDYARFVLDDADAAGAAKRCRHDLRRIIGQVGADELLGARDIVGRTWGAEVKTAGELRRECTGDVVRAAVWPAERGGHADWVNMASWFRLRRRQGRSRCVTPSMS